MMTESTTNATTSDSKSIPAPPSPIERIATSSSAHDSTTSTTTRVKNSRLNRRQKKREAMKNTTSESSTSNVKSVIPIPGPSSERTPVPTTSKAANEPVIKPNTSWADQTASSDIKDSELPTLEFAELSLSPSKLERVATTSKVLSSSGSELKPDGMSRRAQKELALREKLGQDGFDKFIEKKREKLKEKKRLKKSESKANEEKENVSDNVINEKKAIKIRGSAAFVAAISPEVVEDQKEKLQSEIVSSCEETTQKSPQSSEAAPLAASPAPRESAVSPPSVSSPSSAARIAPISSRSARSARGGLTVRGGARGGFAGSLTVNESTPQFGSINPRYAHLPFHPLHRFPAPKSSTPSPSTSPAPTPIPTLRRIPTLPPNSAINSSTVLPEPTSCISRPEDDLFVDDRSVRVVRLPGSSIATAVPASRKSSTELSNGGVKFSLNLPSQPTLPASIEPERPVEHVFAPVPALLPLPQESAPVTVQPIPVPPYPYAQIPLRQIPPHLLTNPTASIPSPTQSSPLVAPLPTASTPYYAPQYATYYSQPTGQIYYPSPDGYSPLLTPGPTPPPPGSSPLYAPPRHSSKVDIKHPHASTSYNNNNTRLNHSNNHNHRSSPSLSYSAPSFAPPSHYSVAPPNANHFNPMNRRDSTQSSSNMTQYGFENPPAYYDPFVLQQQRAMYEQQHQQQQQYGMGAGMGMGYYPNPSDYVNGDWQGANAGY